MSSITQNIVSLEEYNEACDELQQVKDDLARAYGEIQALSIVQQEKEIALQRVNDLQTEMEEMRAENVSLRNFKFRTMAVCSQPHNLFAPYTKIAAIVGPEIPTYPASSLGGDENKRITSMAQWNKAICGTDTNSNCVARNIARLEETGVLKRTEVKLPDGKTVYENEWDETLLRHPRLIENENPRPNNGGNKRCPQCGDYCKKRMTIRYECLKCGIDFDQDMQPIDRQPVVISTIEPVKMSPVEHPVVPEPAVEEDFGESVPEEPDDIREMYEEPRRVEPTQIRPSEPPLACPRCNNVRVDRWTYSKLLQKWECRDCGSYEHGRAS